MSRIFIGILLVFLFFNFFNGYAQQKYVVVERFGGKRIRMVEGDDFHFKLKESDVLFNDYILAFTDSIILISSGIKIHTKDIAAVYFPRHFGPILRKALQTLGISSTLYLFVFESSIKDGDLARPFLTGGSIYAVAQLARLWPRWRKYKMNRNSRIWIYN